MSATTRTRRPRHFVSVAEYKRSHGTAPRGHGRWMFRNETTGEVVTLWGTVSGCKAYLPRGEWALLP